MKFKDYYQILGIQYPSNPIEIKHAYREMYLKWHPDKNKSPEASQMMVLINEAYYILKDDDKKARYNIEYLKFIKIEKDPIDNTIWESSNYDFSDTRVKDDIKEAHKYAQDLVSEFLNSLKQTTKDAAAGAWEKMLPYIMVAIVFTFISLFIRGCQ